ncbi:PIG-L family deacetylase [archaeon]|nr:PIG-L family deacetylase [archaeon]MBT4273049.1 PIG-L family deacetylase [archaeon]MBT4461030.1 PIG-L family deacetylase [archaeon]MBT7440898.1 PIG-L family deacetylase [archaeon]
MLIKNLIDKNKKILIIGAHPDDVEFSTGRLMLKRKGENTHVVILTDGRKGQVNDIEISEKKYAIIRIKESIRALQKLGIKNENRYFLGYRDQELTFQSLAINKIKKIIQKIQPDYILVHPYEGAHPDHDAAHVFTYIAAKKAKYSLNNIIEYSSYNHFGGKYNLQEFIPKETREIILNPTKKEQTKWSTIMREFKSQKTLQKIEIPKSKFEKYRKLPNYNYTKLPYSSTFCLIIRHLISPIYSIAKIILPKKDKLFYERWSKIDPLIIHRRIKSIVEVETN